MFQGNAFQGNAFQTGPDGGGGGEDVTCDKWTGYSVMPQKRRVLSTALAVSIGLVSVPYETPRAEVIAPTHLAKKRVFPHQSLAAPVLADVVTANLDKWFTDSPRVPKRKVPQNIGEFALVQIPDDIRISQWQTDSPRPPLAKPRQQTEVQWTPFEEAAPEVVTVDKWLSYSVTPPKARVALQYRLEAFVQRPDDITLDEWLTESPDPAPARRALQERAPAFVPDPVIVSNWLTDSPDPAPARIAHQHRLEAFVQRPDDITLDEWLSVGVFPDRRPRRPDPSSNVDILFQQAPEAPPLSWATDSPIRFASLRVIGEVRQLSTLSGLGEPIPNAPDVVTVDKWLGTYPYPKLQGNHGRPIDTWSVSPSDPGEPIPNPPVEDFYTVSGSEVTERFIVNNRGVAGFSVSWPWGVKKKTEGTSS